MVGKTAAVEAGPQTEPPAVKQIEKRPKPKPDPERWRPEDRAPPELQRVVVADIHMRFGSMVTFLVQLVLAAIPAMIILWMLVGADIYLGGLLRH